VSEDLIIILGRNFPLDDVSAIGNTLTNSGALVAGYIPPKVGLLAIEGFFYAKDLEDITTTILPDRNLVSRMARIARSGLDDPLDFPTTVAVNLMAFAQALDINIEPSIAFHEFAHIHGNVTAHEELAWFRAADQGAALDWINLALRRSDRLEIVEPRWSGTEDLALPLRRWNRNYIVALKIAELELKPIGHLERALQLLDWMFNDFIVAGPAAAFSTMYFAPSAPRRNIIKHLRSPDRTRAIEGVKNAAWDITYLSDFVERVQAGQEQRQRYIFATADRKLASIAPLLLLGNHETEDQGSLRVALQDWWPAGDACLIADTIFHYVARAEERVWSERPVSPVGFLSSLISESELALRNWRP
jgi:hypothetical protein